MLQSPTKKEVSAAQSAQRCPFSGAVASTPQRKQLADGESETEVDEDTEPRESRCPFGFS